MGNKQLYEKQSNQYNPFFPIVRLDDIIETISDKSIQWILNNYNHIFVEYSESVAITRNKVPSLLRRNGLWISYNNGTEVITEFYKGKNVDINKFTDWTADINWEKYNTIKDGTITYQHLSAALKQMINENEYYITNFPDEEDITTDGTTLSFKDRNYEPNNFSGLGKVILRKNIVLDNGIYKNVLTQDMINKSNTIYEIRYDFDLGGEEITIPEGCVLEFNGGNFNNGVLIISSDNSVIGKNTIFNNIRIIIKKSIKNIKIYNVKFIGNKVLNCQDKNLLVYGIFQSDYFEIHNINIENCWFENYNGGISLKTTANCYINNNVFYKNGSRTTLSGPPHDSEYDISLTGRDASPGIEGEANNIIISNNRCYSSEVHRNIDCGELLSEDNVIIDNNICVCMSDDNINKRDENSTKTQCILVGYGGYTEKRKTINITNNICKDASWGGLYLRRTSGENLTGKTGYIINITGNTIQNIYRDGFTGGINCELRGGSLIANNIITDCTIGINLGFTYDENYCFVTSNIIKNVEKGIITDTSCKKIEIKNNSLHNIRNKGISISEALSGNKETTSKYILITNNNITTSTDFNSTEGALFIWNVVTQKLHITNNTIIHTGELEEGVGKQGVGIRFNTPNSASIICKYNINNNNIYNFNKGIDCYPISYSRRNNGLNIDFNILGNCSTGINVSNNDKYSLLVFEGNSFNGCLNKMNSTYDGTNYFGTKNSDETITIMSSGIRDYNNTKYGYITKALPCFFPKDFKVGDKIIDTSNKYFTEAVVVSKTTEDITDSNTVWKVTNGKFPSSFRPFCAVEGQCIFDTTIKKPIWYTGSKWVDATGADV